MQIIKLFYIPPKLRNYTEIWDECEELESLLNDADIDHESMNYPTDYHELEDLKDEYQSLLEENDVDY